MDSWAKIFVGSLSVLTFWLKMYSTGDCKVKNKKNTTADNADTEMSIITECSVVKCWSRALHTITHETSTNNMTILPMRKLRLKDEGLKQGHTARKQWSWEWTRWPTTRACMPPSQALLEACLPSKVIKKFKWPKREKWKERGTHF